MRFVLGHEGWGGIRKSKKNKTIPGKEKDSSKAGRWEYHRGKFWGKTIWLELGACVGDQ